MERLAFSDYKNCEQVAASEALIPKPFFKWAGGKGQLLRQLSPLLPTRFAGYHEPFAGSAALYWHIYRLRQAGHLDFISAVLSDANPELINAFVVTRDDVDTLCEHLSVHKANHSRDYYYQIRTGNTTLMSPIDRAARFIYLNKTCFNGLYRVNRSGEFNVPMGSYKNPAILEPHVLIQASKALQQVVLQEVGFERIIERANRNDFIYFDPPYVPLSRTSSFTGYTGSSFGATEQRQLAEIFRLLDDRGCKLMLSNSWTEATLQLYQRFNIVRIKAIRAINSNPYRRGRIDEMLVLNYDPGP